MLDHQCVQAILSLQRLLHAAVLRQHTNPTDPPVQRLPVVHQAVQVHRLVRSVEATDPDVNDANRHLVSVVSRDWNRLRHRTQRICPQPHHATAPFGHASPRYCRRWSSPCSAAFAPIDRVGQRESYVYPSAQLHINRLRLLDLDANLTATAGRLRQPSDPGP
jgi:hypothetical protein